MDDNQLYQLYLQYLMEQQAEQQNAGGNIDKIKGYADKISNYGNKLSVVGDTIKDNINNEVAKKLGTSMSNVGGAMQNGANSVTNLLNKPSNYFKGFAGKGLQNVGAKLGTQGGVIGTLGNGISSLGTTVAGGTGAGAATGATAAGTAGTTAGTAGTAGGLTAAGAGTAAGTAAGAGSGAAAGGAAAGGSSAGGAAAGGPIGALVALGVMAAQGANRKRAQKSGDSLLASLNQMSEQGNEEAEQRLAQIQQNSAAASGQARQALANGIMTGGAAQIQQPDPIGEYQEYLRGQGYSDDVINGVPQGLNSGNKDIADWINQYNAGTGRNNPINIPQTDEEIAAARAGTFNNNNFQTGNVTQTDQLKQGLLDKFISGIGDFSRGYEQNRNTAFKPENLREKSFTTPDGQTIAQHKMARLGEVAGTIGRMANKPAVQALLAGGISTALTGNPLYGIGMATRFANQRAMSNIYQNALAQHGINVEPGMFGSITSNDMNTLMQPKYKEQANEILKQKIDEQQRYHDLMMEYYRDKLKETHENNVANQQIKAYKVKNGTVVRHVGSGSGSRSAGRHGGGKTTQSKPQNHKDWNSDLAGYTQRLTNPRYANQIGNMKAKFIEKYGVDPDKYIKL